MGALDRLAGLLPEADQLVAQAGQLLLELDDRLHPREVEPGGGQVLDAAQLLDVAVAVAPAATARAGRVEQALAFVDSQGLGVHARQLGRHRDDVEGPGARFARHDSHTPKWPRGDSVDASARASIAYRSAVARIIGTASS